MNRRAFLTTLLAGAAVDPERLVWTPKRYVQGVTVNDLTGIWLARRSGNEYKFYQPPIGATEIWPQPRNAAELVAAMRVWDELMSSYRAGGWVRLLPT